MAAKKTGAERPQSKNLKVPTSKQAREYGRKGGIKSQQVQKEKRDAMQTAKWLLELTPELQPGTEAMLHRLGVTEKNPTLRLIGMCALFSKMLAGDLQAFDRIFKMVGELPNDSPLIANIIEANHVTINEDDRRKLLDSLTDEQLDAFEEVCSKFWTEEDQKGIEV